MRYHTAAAFRDTLEHCLSGRAHARPRDEETDDHALVRRLADESATEHGGRILENVGAQRQRPMPLGNL